MLRVMPTLSHYSTRNNSEFSPVTDRTPPVCEPPNPIRLTLAGRALVCAHGPLLSPVLQAHSCARHVVHRGCSVVRRAFRVRDRAPGRCSCAFGAKLPAANPPALYAVLSRLSFDGEAQGRHGPGTVHLSQ